MRDPDYFDPQGFIVGSLTEVEKLVEVGRLQHGELRRIRIILEVAGWVCGFVLAVLAALALASEVRADDGSPSKVWLNLGGATYHQHQDRCNSDGRRCNNVNPGIGVEYRIDDVWSVGAMAYRNSQGRISPVAAVQWMPLQYATSFGVAKAGVTAAVFGNYRDEHDERRIVGGPLPTLAIEGKRVGLQAVLIPSTSEKRTTAIALQIKVGL